MGGGGGGGGDPAPAATAITEARAPVGTVAEDPALTATTATSGTAPGPGDASTTAGAVRPRDESLRSRAARVAGGAAAPGASASATAGRPVVWVQAGHVPPGEPGYLAQTGAGGGPFGSERAFNGRTQAALIAWLTSRGVDARPTPALVTPWGSRGAVFISIHFDAPGGGAGIGHATDAPGRHENYYEGEGTGTASPTPYPSSAPHRPHTEVTPAVQRASTRLADDIAARYRRVFTPANGAGSRFRGVEPPDGNVRMVHFYGYYRTNARARVLIETGAAGADDAFLARTDLIATTIGRGILDYLRSTGAR